VKSASLRRLAAAVAGACLCVAGGAAAAQSAQAAPPASTGESAFAADLARARAEVDRREYAQALARYESLLAQRPDDSDLLIEVARVLGFADRNRESAAMYRRVLAVAPQRRADVRRSLAWQTLWAGDAADAEPLFLESAAHDADAADAWRGVAESRRQREDRIGALDVYREALRIDPDDRRSRLGLARALNDAGRHREAVLMYREAKVASLDDGTRFDYARALRWSGFDDLADDELATIEHRDAQWLRRFRTSRERSRWWSAELDASTDRDDLDTRALRAATGWHFADGRALETALRRVHFDDPNGRVDGLRWQTQASARLGSLGSRWGVAWPSVSIAFNDYDGWKPSTGAARVRWLPVDAVRVDAELVRETVETPKAIDQRVHVDVASLGVDFRPALAWTLAGSLAHFRFDDGNERDRVYGRVERTIVSAPRVRAGIEALAFRSSDPTGPAVAWRGYWNPKEYREARLFVSVSRHWREWQVAARAGIGTAREVDGWDTRTSGNPHLLELVLAYDLSPTLQLRAQLGGSGSGVGLAGGGSGYWRRYAGVALTGWF
jgi:tetratricopeptide (TPR) repeat protein